MTIENVVIYFVTISFCYVLGKVNLRIYKEVEADTMIALIIVSLVPYLNLLVVLFLALLLFLECLSLMEKKLKEKRKQINRPSFVERLFNVKREGRGYEARYIYQTKDSKEINK